MAIASKKEPIGYFRRLTLLKKLFWLYFLLLIFEGALRKWVAPPLSAPLLVIRDPVAVWIIWEAYRTRKWPMRWSAVLSLLTVLMIVLFVVQIIFGENLFLVGLYGLSSYLLPFPLLFIMGENLDEDDIRHLGVFTLWLLVPMTLLEVAQYLSPPGSFLNRGAYEGGGQISYVGSHVRASGTFSFNVGSASFAALAAPFILYGMVKERFAPTWLLWVAAFSLVLSVPMVGARTLVFLLAATLAGMGVGAMMGIAQFGRAFRIIVPVLVVSFLVSLLPVFQDASDKLFQRFAGAATGTEGNPLESVVYRVITPVVEKVEGIDLTSNLIGIGLGRSAIAVQAFLTGETAAVAGEDDISREIAEMGPFGWLAYAVFKLFLATALSGMALARAREHEPLGLLLVPLCITSLLVGQLEQTTVQGFMVVGLALLIAATRTPPYVLEPANVPPALRRQQFVRTRPHRRPS